MKTTFDRDMLERRAADVRDANAMFARSHPGESAQRQPVHTVYGGAQLFRADTPARIGNVALTTLRTFASKPAELAAALGIDALLAGVVYDRIIRKIEKEPVEDFRIDFEDGYGHRSDSEEDQHAHAAALELARALQAGTLPSRIGIRIKPLNEELRHRAIRTLDLVLTTLLDDTGGRLPDNFVVTLPKITAPEQITFLAELLAEFERKHRLESKTLKFEVMVETPQSLLLPDGRTALPLFAKAGQGRIVGAHFGPYDFTAALNVTAAYQTMHHPLCSFAREMMQVGFAGTGIWLSDGPTTVMPIPLYRGEELTDEQKEENRRAVHRAWQLHFDDVRASLRLGFYQGWDLHPAQLVTRYAAVYTFFLEGLDAATSRLRNFLQKAGQATLLGETFDDAATGQGLLNFFLRGINTGAIEETEVGDRVGLTVAELRTRSFSTILRQRSIR